MRLYKDVKVELTATLKINIHYLAKCPATIRNKANGSMEILSIDMPYTSATAFEKTLSFIDYMQLVEDKKHMKVLCEQPIGQNVDYVRTDFERQDRTHVNFIVDYKAHFSYKLIVDVDGRLFIGNGSSFEDCFETKLGEKLEELIDSIHRRACVASGEQQALNNGVWYDFKHDISLYYQINTINSQLLTPNF